ncbi:MULTISPECIES: RNA polymerase-binding protein DksA [Candidatus Ichthyocystis]|uniref:RNA polymerase-binding transcription factor DksA n=1 Tax=Candidatus Ichthyocystis hellenicum TaxID=1561003 RepID=A0A0S4M7F5_9BURK|nr:MULTISPECIES: RNA polymerase-binding protein DksA [Ichthyocystis]CUT18214.1 putative DnaK suppressor protein [Candidatus Ichthyocystis hellenicum]
MIDNATQSSSSKKDNNIITEELLLSMDDSEYMNEEQIKFFRHKLEVMRSELLENVNQTAENLRDTPVVPDLVDRATIEEEYALELRTRNRESKLLSKIETALERINDGTYGWCEETGEPIGIRRLLARPTTALSIEAQRRREIRQKLYND